MKINNFRGELTDISAKKEALVNRHQILKLLLWFSCLIFKKNLHGVSKYNT